MKNYKKIASKLLKEKINEIQIMKIIKAIQEDAIISIDKKYLS